MDFIENNKPIYLQIVDKLCDEIIAGRYVEGERIPSVRETAAQVEVNANTVMRSYDKLQQDGIIYNKRGIGFFVCEGARRAIQETRTSRFLDSELQETFSRLALLKVSPDELRRMYNEFLDKSK